METEAGGGGGEIQWRGATGRGRVEESKELGSFRRHSAPEPIQLCGQSLKGTTATSRHYVRLLVGHRRFRFVRVQRGPMV